MITEQYICQCDRCVKSVTVVRDNPNSEHYSEWRTTQPKGWLTVSYSVSMGHLVERKYSTPIMLCGDCAVAVASYVDGLGAK